MRRCNRTAPKNASSVRPSLCQIRFFFLFVFVLAFSVASQDRWVKQKNKIYKVLRLISFGDETRKKKKKRFFPERCKIKTKNEPSKYIIISCFLLLFIFCSVLFLYFVSLFPAVRVTSPSKFLATCNSKYIYIYIYIYIEIEIESMTDVSG